MKCFPLIAWLSGKGLRIQAEEHHQDTPDGPDVDLFTGIHYKVVAFSKEVDAHCIDGKVNQPLVLHEEPQNCTHKTTVMDVGRKRRD